MAWLPKLWNRLANAIHQANGDPITLPNGKRSAPVSGNYPFNSQSWASPRLVGQIDAARIDRFGNSWVGTPITPDERIRLWGRILVARSRDMAINDPYMRQFVRMAGTNIVGHGLKLRCLIKKGSGDTDKKTNQAVLDAWQDWGEAENCDITGQQSFVELCLTIVRSLVVDGEAFVHIVDDGPYGLQLEIIDAVRCPHDWDRDEPNTATYVRAGIRYDYNDKPISYLFLENESHGSYYGTEALPGVEIPASKIRHIYKKEYPGQKRGTPWAVSSLWNLKNVKEFENNAVICARIGASKMGTLEQTDPDLAPERPEDEKQIKLSAEAGTFMELPAGMQMKPWDPSFPDSAFTPFMKTALRSVAAGMGVNYTSLANDLEGVNFSSIRAGMMEEREMWKEEQHLMIQQFVQPIFRQWLKLALLKNLVQTETGKIISPLKFDQIKKACSFHGRRWDWVDPKSDVAANRMAMDSLIKSPQHIIRERGHDPDKMLDDFQDWFDECERRGLPKNAMQVAEGDMVKAMAQSNDGDNGAESTPPGQDTKEEKNPNSEVETPNATKPQ